MPPFFIPSTWLFITPIEFKKQINTESSTSIK